MKIRNGFVTNSSSSSFVIKSKKEVSEDIAKHFIEFNKENFTKNYLDEMCGYYVDSYLFSSYDENKEEETIKLLKLTPEQVTMLKLEKHDLLQEYLRLKKQVENKSEDEFIYYLYADRDWLYYQDEINNFIAESETLDHQTDL